MVPQFHFALKSSELDLYLQLIVSCKMTSWENQFHHYEAFFEANSQGIIFMKHRRYSDAISRFKKGLMQIQFDSLQNAACTLRHNGGQPNELQRTSHFQINDGGYHNQASVHSPNEAQRYHISRSSDVPFLMHCAVGEDIEVVLSVSILDGVGVSEEEELFLPFNRALTMPINIAWLLAASESLRFLSSAILLYNIGLSLYLNGRQRGASHLIGQAIQFYHASYHILRDHNLINQPNLSALPVMALLNNIGHIHAYFYRFLETSICRQDLSLHLSTKLSSVSQIGSQLTEEESEIFVKNCVSYPAWQHLAAPSA